jgi:hypothetical protein
MLGLVRWYRFVPSLVVEGRRQRVVLNTCKPLKESCWPISHDNPCRYECQVQFLATLAVKITVVLDVTQTFRRNLLPPSTWRLTTPMLTWPHQKRPVEMGVTVWNTALKFRRSNCVNKGKTWYGLGLSLYLDQRPQLEFLIQRRVASHLN